MNIAISHSWGIVVIVRFLIGSIHVKLFPNEVWHLRYLYKLLYMDNSAVIRHLFNSTKFQFGLKVQEFITNDIFLIDKYLFIFSEPIGYRQNLGYASGPPKIKLNATANTKQHSFKLWYLPILNRSRISMHEIQCKQNFQWDDILDPQAIKRVNICHQVNTSPEISIPFRRKSFGNIRTIWKMFYGAPLIYIWK